jgi:hypothetical protein
MPFLGYLLLYGINLVRFQEIVDALETSIRTESSTEHSIFFKFTNKRIHIMHLKICIIPIHVCLFMPLLVKNDK